MLLSKAAADQAEACLGEEHNGLFRALDVISHSEGCSDSRPCYDCTFIWPGLIEMTYYLVQERPGQDGGTLQHNTTYSKQHKTPQKKTLFYKLNLAEKKKGLHQKGKTV